MTYLEMQNVVFARRQDAIAAQQAVDTAYAMGRFDGAVRAHAVAVRAVAARARRDLDVVRRNRELLAAASRA